MNQDNNRLKEIQLFKCAYANELEQTETIEDSLRIQAHIDELEKEEKEILERTGVKI